MKISIDWLGDFIALDKTPEALSDVLTMSGLEVEGLSDFESIAGGLNGLCIGEVRTCVPHPNADKLKLTAVDVGKAELLSIVCGAPNVAAGQKVVVATVGAVLHPIEGAPFKIKKAKIRGEKSEGMICAEDEIGLGAEHDGIMVIDTDLPNGTPAAAYFEVTTDKVLEIGLTPNRADAASHYGVARDLSACLDKPIKFPDLTKFKPTIPQNHIAIAVENTEACPRYAGIFLSGLRISPSPDWLKNRLKALGLTPINNVVDVTNYVLHSLGQPLHAFDANKIEGQKIIVKTLPAQTPFVTLDGQTRQLHANDLMICDTQKPLCIAGVFGGLSSGVTAQTKNIFLESAYFSPAYVRKTAQRHTLKTDASFRFERGTDPNMPPKAAKWAAILIKSLAGGEYSEIVDVYPNPIQNFYVEAEYKNINRLIGEEIKPAEAKKILKNLEIDVISETSEKLHLSVPPYRVDVRQEADIIEELLRIYGYDNIDVSPALGADYLAPTPEKDAGRLQLSVRQMLAGGGLQEIMTNSITNSRYTEILPDLAPKKSISILNALSADLNALRQTLLCNALETVAHNLNRRQNDLHFFEFGKVYSKENGEYTEKQRLSLCYTGNEHPESWRLPAKPSDFYVVNEQILKIFTLLGIRDYNTETLSASASFSYGLTYKHGKQILGKVGETPTALLNHFGIRQAVFYAELDWDVLLSLFTPQTYYQEISRFPQVRRDLSLVMDKNQTFAEIKALASKSAGGLLKKINVFDIYEGNKLEENQKSYSVSFILESSEKTLSDKAIDKTMSRLMRAFEKEMNILIRK